MKPNKMLLFYFMLFSALYLVQGKVYTASTCEGHSLKLSCYIGDVIKVLDGDYGRWNASACPYYEDPNMILNCHSRYAATILEATCNGHRTCKIKANNDNFMDPCPGQIKHAEAKYICVPKPKQIKIGHTYSSDEPVLNKGISTLYNMYKMNQN